jgi:hypothetical protein
VAKRLDPFDVRKDPETQKYEKNKKIYSAKLKLK